MKSKFGKIWRITMAMALVLALVPVLAVSSPVGAVEPNNNVVCCDVEVKVCPAIVDCDSGSENKEFEVTNNGSCDIGRIEISVPVEFTLLDPVTHTKPSGWNLDVEVLSGEILVLKFWTTTDPIPAYGGVINFTVNDVGIPVLVSGIYWWDWEAWSDPYKGCDPFPECAQPTDPDCSGSAKQSVDCDSPEVSIDCATDCSTIVDDFPVYQRGDGPYWVYAIVTDTEGNLDTVELWGNIEKGCDAPEGQWNKKTMNPTGVPNEYKANLPPDKPDSTDIYYKVVATDLAGHVTESECCHFHVDKSAPVVEVVVSDECFAPGQPVPITVNATYPYDAENPDLEDLAGNVPEVKVNGSAAYVSGPTGSTPTWEFVYEYTGEGSDDCDHAVVATLEDCIGNKGSDQASFEVDGIAPDCPDVSGEACPLENKLWWECVDDEGTHCPDGDVFYRVYRDDVGLIDTTEVGECYPESGDPWIDTYPGLVDGTTYCYTVTAVDERGNVRDDCQPVCLTYFVGQEPHDYTFGICAGWNMISLPKIPFNPNILGEDGVLEGVLDQAGEVVWGYDPGTGWHSSNHLGAGELAQMVDGQGYWLYSLVADTVTGQGWDMAVGPVTPPLYPVQAGWNLIGFKSQEEMCPVDYLWRLLVADATGSAIFTMGYDVFVEWWDTWGAAAWFAHVEALGAGDVYPSEVDWLTWWETVGEAAFDAHVGQYHTSEWAQMQVSLELQFSNLLMMLFGYDCDCDFLDYYVPSMMVPGQGYWLYVPDSGEILPIGMEYLFFLQVMGGGGYCPDGLCL